MPLPVSWAQVIQSAIEGQMADTHTAMPGKVLSYNALRQTCSVQPLLKRVLFDTGGEKSYESLPAVADVPVAFPRAGGHVLSMPLAAGDYVLLVFNEASLAEFRSTGDEAEPGDIRRHCAGYPVAIPCFYPDSQPLSPADPHSTKAIFGLDGLPQQIRISATGIELGTPAVSPVVLSIPLLVYLGAIHTTVAAIPDGTPVTGAILKTVFTPALLAALTAAGPSVLVKAL